MSDRPKPGKDKDLRFIRQAIDETDKLYLLLSEGIDAHLLPDTNSLYAEALLLTIDQLDLLDQMLGSVMLIPTPLIEYNRCLRTIFRTMMQHKLTEVDAYHLTRMIQAIGDQLKSLLIVKEIRSTD
jgi:hypothetical protein